jgi:hypothetical protein
MDTATIALRFSGPFSGFNCHVLIHIRMMCLNHCVLLFVNVYQLFLASSDANPSSASAL